MGEFNLLFTGFCRNSLKRDCHSNFTKNGVIWFMIKLMPIYEELDLSCKHNKTNQWCSF